MHTLQQPYRDVYDQFYDYEGSDFYDDLVLPHERFAEFMESFGLQRIEREAFHPFFQEEDA